MDKRMLLSLSCFSLSLSHLTGGHHRKEHQACLRYTNKEVESYKRRSIRIGLTSHSKVSQRGGNGKPVIDNSIQQPGRQVCERLLCLESDSRLLYQSLKLYPGYIMQYKASTRLDRPCLCAFVNFSLISTFEDMPKALLSTCLPLICCNLTLIKSDIAFIIETRLTVLGNPQLLLASKFSCPEVNSFDVASGIVAINLHYSSNKVQLICSYFNFIKSRDDLSIKIGILTDEPNALIDDHLGVVLLGDLNYLE